LNLKSKNKEKRKTKKKRKRRSRIGPNLLKSAHFLFLRVAQQP
jgi:hypothetical protein